LAPGLRFARIRGCEDDPMPRHASRSLVIWSGVLLVALAGHDLSHALDGGLKTPLDQLALVAVPQWLALAVVMGFVVRGGRARGTVAALLLGVVVVVGFGAIHLLPFSTASYWDLRPSAVSWVLAVLPTALGLVVAALAWSQWRAQKPVGGVAAATHTA
jgi:hypothetical protein